VSFDLWVFRIGEQVVSAMKVLETDSERESVTLRANGYDIEVRWPPGIRR
jgi:hypothetical protein